MPLQKSFSEQSRYSKRPQWQRAKSHSSVPQTTAAPQPLIPVSESTRNKLQKFRCLSPPTEGQESATNVPREGNADRINSLDVENAYDAKDQDVSPTAPDRVQEATTPLSRLVWKELMGESNLVLEDKQGSPTERITWNNNHDPQSNPSLAASSPMPPRKGRKRARSSSPTSSPGHSKPTTPAVNVKKLTQALKTPHADPTLELWDRFSLPGARMDSASASGLTNPALAHLMISSSPRPPKDGATPQTEGSLRRAISCGTHWPKRRKIERQDAESLAIARGSPRRNMKSSMVSALLETVTGEINKVANAESRAHVEKSPSPHKQLPAQGQRRRTPSPKKRQSPMKHQPSPSSSHAQQQIEDGGKTETGSDYGDDDFDDFDEDTLMGLDASFSVPPQEEATVTVELGHESNETRGEPPPKAAVSDDEFDDMDADVFDAAETLIAEIDSQHTSQLPDKHHVSTAASARVIEGINSNYDGDEFDDFDFDAAERAATQSAASRAASSALNLSQKPKAIQRYFVTNVVDSSYVDDNERELPEKILIVQAERTGSIKTLHLRDDWYDTPVSTKSYVHIIGHFEPLGQCIINNSQNILILHPDQLISSTVIADSFSCMRRAVLQDRVKATSDSSPALVYGTILHEIFQEALMANRWDPVFLRSLVDKALVKHVEELYVIKVSASDATEHLLSKMAELRSWAAAFVSPHPRPDAIVQGRNGEKINMCVSKLLDVEEHVWSPMYGLKGNIDATVQVTMRDGKETKTLTVPFEVKTGKNMSSNHQAQTVLYNLLLSDRYDIEIVYGVLYYMETSQTLRIPAIRTELRHMIMGRNQLACYVRERSVQMPPMKRSKNVCGKCYAQTSCFIYHKLADDGTGETSGVGSKFEEVVKHLTPTHKEFFLKWEDLLTKEEKESQKHRRELWTMVSTEREKLGRCFANVVIEEGSASEDRQSNKINRFHYTFVKLNHASGFSFLDSQLTVGEPVVVSDEQGHFALAIGYVTAVRKQRISVAVDRRLHNARIRQPGFDEVNNQVFASIMDVVPEGERPEQSQGRIKEAPIQYRLDKDEFSNGMATVRNNLVQVMADGPFGSRRIREVVVDLMPPKFKAVSTQYTISDKESLNVDQKKAIEKVMSAMDYALVLGMPGTGKTTTIAHIIRALVSQGKSVLLTSYTHTAVDNILLKLKNDSLPILRLGAPAKVHPEVQDFVTLAGQPMSSFEEIRQAWHETPVVATTCLGINHPIFNERTFDYCIVDEASQITLPICLGPIRMAHTFVLVGDHNQLPPLVQNEEAKQGGLDVSLFKLLSDTHPESVVNLEHQYRMCEDIMTLSNTLIYHGRLKCGTEELRHRSLDVPHMEALQRHHFDASAFLSLSQKAAHSMQKSFCPGPNMGSCWLRDLLDPSVRAAFVNTDGLGLAAREEAKGNRIVNPAEARVVAQLVEALLTAGVAADEIGVMTHYRSQLALLRHHVPRRDIEMHTADRFQGRDKAVVVLSLVRSNDACAVGDLLRDWRRINVAFTRAKAKLLVVGSRDTLRGCGEDEMLARFIALMEDRSWVHDLPPDALDAHVFDDATAGVTQASSVGVGLGAAAFPAAAMQETVSGALAVGGGGEKIKNSPAKTPKRKTAAPLSSQAGMRGKENMRPEPKRAKMGERALLKGKPVLRDILNDMMDGMY